MYRGIFLCVFIAVSASAYRLAPTEPPLDPNVQQCINETGIGFDIINRRMDNITDSEILDSKIGCYMSCLWRKQGSLKEDGTLDAAIVVAKLPSNIADPEEVHQAFNECSKQKGANHCETASKTLLCLNHNEFIRNIRPRGEKIRKLH